jgi:hypothetical protein
VNIHIAIHYVHRGNRKLRRGDFPVYRYKEDPLGEAVRVAKEWVIQIMVEEPELRIEKIIVDNKDDITEMVLNNLRIKPKKTPFLRVLKNINIFTIATSLLLFMGT